MPITPFHLGPGPLIKAVLREKFSFTIFAASQIAIDIEPAYHIFAGSARLHQEAHTLLGAMVLGVLVAFIAKPACELFLQLYKRWLDFRNVTYEFSCKITVSTALVSAFVGTVSHVLIDALMHADLYPFAPFTEANPLLGLVSIDAIHLICVGTGAVGVALMLIKRPATTSVHH